MKQSAWALGFINVSMVLAVCTVATFGQDPSERDSTARERIRQARAFTREPETVLIHGNTVIVMGREVLCPTEILPMPAKPSTAVTQIVWMKKW